MNENSKALATTCPQCEIMKLFGSTLTCNCAAELVELEAMHQRLAVDPQSQRAMERHRELVRDVEAWEGSSVDVE